MRGPHQERLWLSLAKSRDYLLPDDLDRAHDLVVRGAADLEHEDHLIDARLGPAFHLPANAVGIAADRHAARQQVVVAVAGHARLDPRHAFRRTEPYMIQLGVV